MAAVKELVAIFIVGASFICCECSFVNVSPKCRASDYECQRNVIQYYLRNIGNTGIQDLDNISIDPFDITGVNVPVYDLIDLNVIEGNVKGIKDCEVTKFVMDFHRGKIFSDSVCDFVVNNKYRVSSYNPLIKFFLGVESLHGEGSGQLNVEKIRITLDQPFDLVQRNNNVYVNTYPGYGNITFDILGKVQFHADKLHENDQASDILIRFMNDNWKLVVNFVFRVTKDVTTDYIYSFNSKFFKNVPLRSFIIEDFFSSNIYG